MSSARFAKSALWWVSLARYLRLRIVCGRLFAIGLVEPEYARSWRMCWGAAAAAHSLASIATTSPPLLSSNQKPELRSHRSLGFSFPFRCELLVPCKTSSGPFTITCYLFIVFCFNTACCHNVAPRANPRRLEAGVKALWRSQGGRHGDPPKGCFVRFVC